MQKKERVPEWTGWVWAVVSPPRASLRGDIEVSVGFWRAALKKEEGCDIINIRFGDK